MLTITSEHALRALAVLASAPDGPAVLGRELSERAAVPSTYLSKIMLTLRNGGLVTAVRGSGGGYRLARPASEIALIDIVELFEGPAARPRCVLGLQDCNDQRPCSAHDAWSEVRSRYVNFLERTTLADIAEQPRRKRSARTRS